MKNYYTVFIFFLASFFVTAQQTILTGSFSFRDNYIDSSGNFINVGQFSDDDTDFDPDLSVEFKIPSPINDPLNLSNAFIQKLDVGGKLIWAKGIYIKQLSTTDNEVPFCNIGKIVSDDNNNIYVAGSFAGEIFFKAGDDEITLKSGSDEDVDGFVAKYSSDGDFIWARHIKDENPNGNINLNKDQVISSLVIYNNKLIFGTTFRGKINFDINENNSSLEATSTRDGFFYDILLVGADLDGNYSWHNFIRAEQKDNIYFNIRLRDLAYSESGLGVLYDVFISNSKSDMSYQKLDINHNFVFKKYFSSIGEFSKFFANKTIFDNSGNIYIGGRFIETVDFNSSSTEVNSKEATKNDIFLLKLDVNGNYIWVRTIDNNNLNSDTPTLIDLEIYDGKPYLYGRFRVHSNSIYDLDNGETDGNEISDSKSGIFLASYDNIDGTIIGSHFIEYVGDWDSSFAPATMLVNDSQIYLTGAFGSRFFKGRSMNFEDRLVTLDKQYSSYITPVSEPGILSVDKLKTKEKLTFYIKDNRLKTTNKNYQITTVYNMLGQFVFNHNLQSGIYIIYLQNKISKEMIAKKIIVE